MPYSAGVNYGVPEGDGELATYVMNRRHLRKARNIARNPHVSTVVPLARRVLWFLPPATVQLRGRAEILDWTDRAGTEVFGRFGWAAGSSQTTSSPAAEVSRARHLSRGSQPRLR